MALWHSYCGVFIRSHDNRRLCSFNRDGILRLFREISLRVGEGKAVE